MAAARPTPSAISTSVPSGLSIAHFAKSKRRGELARLLRRGVKSLPAAKGCSRMPHLRDRRNRSLVRFRPGRFLKHQCRVVCSMTCTTPRRLNALSRAFAQDRVSKSRQTTNAKSRVPSSRTRIIAFNFRASYKKRAQPFPDAPVVISSSLATFTQVSILFSTPCGSISRRSRVSRILSRRATGHKQNSAALRAVRRRDSHRPSSMYDEAHYTFHPAAKRCPFMPTFYVQRPDTLIRRHTAEPTF